MGVGYIIGPKIAGVLVAGGVLSWFVFIPLLASLLNDNGGVIAAQLAKLGYLKDISTAGGRHLPGLYQADWCRCCCCWWFYNIDKNYSYNYFFI